MRSSKGGMQTSGAQYSIYCPKCGKPAARLVCAQGEDRYMHFTKMGRVWHIVAKEAEGVSK